MRKLIVGIAIAALVPQLVHAQAVGGRIGSSTPIMAAGASVARTLGAQLGDDLKLLNSGATCNGVVDDTAYLQAAISAASVAEKESHDYGTGEGRNVRIPSGKTCRVTGPISITADGIGLIGDGANSSAIMCDFPAGTPTSDCITFGPTFGTGYKARVRDLMIYQNKSAGSTMTATTLRDLLVIGGNWSRLDNVNLWGAGRYGLRVQGTLNLQANAVRVSYSGASGVYVDYYPGDTDVNTTTVFRGLYSARNQHHGVLVRQASALNLYDPILEWNGRAGNAALGDGLRLGVDVTNRYIDASVFGGYVEQNPGWDFQAGVGITSDYHSLNLYGVHASATGKSAGYGFFYGTRTRGAMVGNQLLNYGSFTTYSLDNLCYVSITGRTFDATLQPVYRPSPGNWYAYAGGIVEWRDTANGDQVRQYGGAATRRVSAPASASSTCQLGDWANASGFYYSCIAANTWQRVAIATW